MKTLSRRISFINRPNVLLPVVAMLAGGAAAIGAGQYVKTRAADAERQIRSQYETRRVVVAGRDITSGQKIDGKALALRSMPAAFLPPDAVLPSQAGALLGESAAIDIRRGTPVVMAALQTAQLPEPLAAQLGEGRRALTIQVDQINSLAGQLSPGDRIDLLYSRGQQSAEVLVPLLESVQVLATGAEADSHQAARTGASRDVDFNTITLLVTADEAARIVLAEQTGRVTVLLRAPEDAAPLEIQTRNSRQLLSTPRLAVVRNSQDFRIELLTGGGGGVQPARTWLAVGSQSAGGAL